MLHERTLESTATKNGKLPMSMPPQGGPLAMSLPVHSQRLRRGVGALIEHLGLQITGRVEPSFSPVPPIRCRRWRQRLEWMAAIAISTTLPREHLQQLSTVL